MAGISADFLNHKMTLEKKPHRADQQHKAYGSDTMPHEPWTAHDQISFPQAKSSTLLCKSQHHSQPHPY